MSTPSMTSAQAKEWVAAWKRAGPMLEEVRRAEIRALVGTEKLQLLCGDVDYNAAPRLPRTTSGLVEQQYWLQKARSRD